jgi:hypothetical protein
MRNVSKCMFCAGQIGITDMYCMYCGLGSRSIKKFDIKWNSLKNERAVNFDKHRIN